MLGYECLTDTLCGNQLVLITDSSVLLIRNHILNVKRKSKRIVVVSIVVFSLIFSNVKSAEAIFTNLPPQQRVVIIMRDQDANKLIRPSKVNIHLEKHPKLIMPSLSKNVKKPRETSLPVGIYLMEDRFLRTPEVSEAIRKVRGGDLTEIGVFLAFIGIMLLMASNSQGFVSPGIRVVQPHEQGIYGNNRPNHNFGYVKNSMRITSVSGATQNAGSEKKEPGKVSYEYQEVMQELKRQSSKKMVEIQVGDQIYSLKNPYCEDASELGYKLADQMYDSIRECDTDICDIAKNLGFKADNIKNVKDHVFYQKHELDQYVSLGEASEYKRFDPYIHQALAWKRLESGTHTQEDITWIKHECAERHHELKYGSGYSEAHARAQTRFDGAPWENQF